MSADPATMSILIGGFDHAMIAVRDLAEATRRYQSLGFSVAAGSGRHPGRGTRNVIFHFGWGFLELIAIEDPAERALLGAEGDGLTNFLAAHDGGLIDVILTTDAIDEVARRLADADVDVGEQRSLGRERPDGLVTENRVLPIGPMSSRCVYPQFIQWLRADPERLARTAPSPHENAAAEVIGVSMITNDLDRATSIYRDTLGLPVTGKDVVDELGAHRVRCTSGALNIDLLAPAGAGLVQADLDRFGDGPFEIRIRVDDAARTHRHLGQRIEPAPGVDGGWLLPEDLTMGARLVLVEPASETT